LRHFPDPIRLPNYVFIAREERNRQLVTSAAKGMAIRLSIVLLEIVGVVIFGSSALLMDALSSFLDITFTGFLIYFIKLADKPPDNNHPFGHGRFEPLVGLLLGGLLAAFGLGMFIQQLMKINPTIDEQFISPYAWLIPFIAVILLELCYRFVMKTAKRQNSAALAADALHYRIDSLTSLFAAIALVLAAVIPTWGHFIDHIGAIVIAIVMIAMGVYAGRNNADQLVDRVPERKFFDQVKSAAMNVTGVKGTEKIRIQLYGPDAHVNIDVEVAPDLSVDEAHKISQKVRAEIQKEWPAVRDVTVHIEPYYPGDH